MSDRTNSDKFLLAIAAGAVLLIVVAFIVVSRRPDPQFQGGGTPESVVHDYLLALQLGDYETAYSLLSPDLAYPADINEFYDSLRQTPWQFTVSDNYSMVVESSEAISENSVAVIVREIYNTNALFAGDGYSSTFRMRVENGEEGWKLVSGENYWSSCWGESNQCLDGIPRTVEP
ncbi:MAG: hypothetical protein ACK2U5_00870 [Candidatus Promineifilaceae bacterium]|jgi:hypothetical protein